MGGPNPLGQFGIMGTGHKGPAADHRQLLLLIEFNRHGKALQSRVAAIVSDGIRFDSAAMRKAAEWITEPYVIGRRLQRFTDRVVISDSQRRRLVALNQQQRDSGRLRDGSLNLWPALPGSLRLLLQERFPALCRLLLLCALRHSGFYACSLPELTH